MIYVVGIVMAIMVALWGNAKVATSAANKARADLHVSETRADTAEKANATLAAQIPPLKAQCDAATKTLGDLAKEDIARAERAKAARAKAATARKAQQSIVDEDLMKIASDVTTKWEVACEDATRRLTVLADDRLRQQAERDHVR